MNTWALSEVLQAYAPPPPEVHNTHNHCSRPFMGLSHGGPHEESQLRYLYDTYRAPPSMLARYARTPDKFRALIAEQVRLIKPDGLRNVLYNPDSDDSSHLIVRIEPPPDDRTKSEKTIASQGALELLWDRHLKNSTAEMSHLYTALGGGTVMAPAVGGILQLRMHQLFRLGYSPLLVDRTTQEFDIYVNYSASQIQQNSKTLQLTVSDGHLLVDGMQLQVDHYYRPGKNFPTIDSLLLIHPANELPILLMFQIIRSTEKHNVKPSGLERVNRIGFPPGTRRYYVAVTPVGMQPEIHVLKGHLANVGVYHHPVDESTLFLPQ